MQTAVLRRPRHMEIVDRPLPVAGPGEAVVRIAANALCQSDVEMYTGRHPNLAYPIVLGHEATGTIVSVGAESAGLRPGQNVLINPVISCGHCDCCRRGDAHLCRNAGLFGREIEGALSQYVCLPARYLHPLPPHLPLDQATLIETLATVRHAQQRAAVTAGESVVVLGQGTTGLLHTRLAVLAGADPVIAVSRSHWKLEMAKRMGAHATVATHIAAAVAEVLRLCGGTGVDLVIDTVGGAATLPAGIAMLRPGGRFCSFSLSHEEIVGFSAFPLYFKEISIIGARALTPGDMQAAIDLVASRAVDVSGFITASYPLAQAGAALEVYDRDPSRILRIVIDVAT